MVKAQGKENYYLIDLVKFICALLVVMLHLPGYAFADMAVDGAPPTGGGSSPLILYVLPLAYTILRIAVPFFLITSAFFIFKKIKENPENRKEILKNYCLRLFKLWLFWFVISLPYMIDKFIFNSGEVWYNGLVTMLLNIIFRGGFDGAWFLHGLMISVLIVERLSRCKHGNVWAFVLSLALYLLAILDGCYFGIFKGTFMEPVLRYLNKVMPLYNSFFAGMLYVFIGKWFADNPERIKQKISVIMMIVFIPLMYGELLLVNVLGLSIETDCFLTLIPFSIFFMQFLLNTDIKAKPIYLKMRKASTFIYLCHFILLYVFYRFVYAFNWTIFISNVPMTILMYFVIVGLCIGLCALVSWLSKKKRMGWLRYAL